MHSVRLKYYDLVLLIKTFSFNYFKVRLFLSFCFFLVEGCLLPSFKNETSVTLKHPYYKFYCLIPLKMVVLTRKQSEKLSKEELINELLTVNSIHEDLVNLTSRFGEFLEKYAPVESELEVSKNCMKLLSKQIETLQENALDFLQYHRREMIEINPVPQDIQDL